MILQGLPPSQNGTVQILVAVIVVLGGVLSALIAQKVRKKTPAETESVQFKTSKLIFEMSNEQMDRIERERDRLEIRIGEVEHIIEGLTRERNSLLNELAEERAARIAAEDRNRELERRVSDLERQIAGMRES